jgi:hypothetical protein
MTSDFQSGPPQTFKAIDRRTGEETLSNELGCAGFFGPEIPETEWAVAFAGRLDPDHHVIRQAVGLPDAQGQAVYFGDVLIHPLDPDWPMVVMVWHEGTSRLAQLMEDDPRIALLGGDAKGWLEHYVVMGNRWQRESALAAQARELRAEHQKAGETA